jgi:uncharacterized phage protein gp47/JayE
MPVQVPTTQEVTDNIVAQLESALSQTIPLLPKAFVRVLAKALSGVTVQLYRLGGFNNLSLFIRYASDQETEVLGRRLIPLHEWGEMVGVGKPKSATAAQLTVTVAVTQQTGELKAFTRLLRAETGVLYSVVAPVPLNAATVPAQIVAVAGPDDADGSGTIGNLQVGDQLTFANPPPNVGTTVTVASVDELAVDAEPTEVYRARVLRRSQRKPQGGAYADYQLWSEEVVGVVHAYPYTADTPGEVDVYVEVDTSLEPDGIPDAGKLAEVLDSIELDEEGLPTRRPANAAVNVLPIVRTGFEIEVAGLDPNTTENQIAIDAAVDEHLRSREPFIVGLSTLPRTDRVTNAAVAGVVDAAVSALGAVVVSVQLKEGGGGATNGRTLARGEKAKLFASSYI